MPGMPYFDQAGDRTTPQANEQRNYLGHRLRC